MKIKIKNETDEILNLVIEPYLIYYDIPPGGVAELADAFKEIFIVYTNKNLISVYGSQFTTVSVDGVALDSV